MAEQPTVLIIGPTPPPHHGVAAAVKALLDSKLAETFAVRHVDLADRRGLEHVDRPDLGDVWLFLLQWFGVVLALLRGGVRLVYIPLSQSTIGVLRDSLLMWPARLVGAHAVLHLHGGAFRMWYESRSRIVKAYVRAVLASAARVVVLDDSFRVIFKGLVESSRIDVVPNGVADRGLQSGGAFSRRPVRILYLGTLSRPKGTLVLINAVRLIAATRPDVEFTLAGEWWREEDRTAAHAILAHHGTAGLVRFPGRVEGRHKAELLASADVFVFPGVQQEGQPLVVIEAMAAGLPVIFTDRGCLRNTVSADAGIEIPINDPGALAAALVGLIYRPEQVRRMGLAARSRYERLFTLDRYAMDMVQVFTRALGDDRVARRVALAKDHP
jgi:glycosyltransferase involved in cell wall biosynthesis